MNFLKGRVFKNASWIVASKLLQSIFAFFINILTARYLGPSNYGIISYAASLVTFVLPIAQLGFNNTLVKELTQDPENEGKILGTSISFSLFSALFCIIGVISFAILANFDDKEAILVTALYSLNIIFQVFDLIQYWFQTKLLSKYSSISSLIAYIVVSIYKLFLLISQKNIYWFAVSQGIDYFLIAVFLFLLYKKLGGQKFSFDFALGRHMFSQSRYYIVTGLMIAIFSQTDKIMLKSMQGEAATGYYSAAVSIASISGFVYVAIIDSFRPTIFASQKNKEQFEFKLKLLYSIIIYISIFQSVVMTIFADLFVDILYGPEFVSSAGALRVIVWFVTFSYMGSIRNIWILANNKQKYLWIINAAGAVLNVILNLVLIPFLGIVGASIASFATQFFSNFILGFIIKPIRENNRIIIHSLNPKYILDLMKTKN